MKKYILTIRPAIPPETRHQLQDKLKDMGFYVIGGGTHTDGSECDISFDEKEEKLHHKGK